MKKIIICLVIVISVSQTSCKKFLNIIPINQLTGNNFYASREDVENNITDMYGSLFDKYVTTNTAGAMGEFRSGEAIPAQNGSGARVVRVDVAALGGHTRRIANSGVTQGLQSIPLTTVNDRRLLDAMGGTDPVTNSPNPNNFGSLQSWNAYYRVIQQANLLISKLQEGVPGLNATQTASYIAEAKFIRCFCYFFMVRLYGDVVYYTAAFQKDPLPRTDMVVVINNCLAELRACKNDMEMSVSNPSLRGVRACRGAIIGLMMNMNMWNAGFDPANKNKYYQETDALGLELMTSNAFRLLPLTEWATVTKGRSEESLFELFTTVNYNSQQGNAFAQVFNLAPFGEAFIHFPYKLPEYDNRTSPCVLTADYMNRIYADRRDDRLTIWFDAPFDQNAETFQLKKFAGNSFLDASNPSLTGNPDNTFLIFRYADAILLRAEALAELGNETIAADVLNVVRSRANATQYPSSADNNIKEAIFYERQKELMGEGARYPDLVRTKRILSKTYADNPLTADKFGRGAWTWPISESSLQNNPFMTLNAYWRGTGL
ncbi:RagB/SusD family nutrient uptake outer membrane protein [Mucilaginibacter myungsuensis]|uniref:RagB/SusD family nutrient uptake outer membrane protein n=1 Tax=Mucilaginibacter myungsuensis TaxID=649104 RepID=A0A929L7K4_9SPHI|nr:RagB/SusD family nutrient uptake outer membrane protein [Mucilaginibacter myungsuensis]MBE9664636.1 RagB/SusD family nutrient uptake outer membrane protein [Mucilaginibacter myungsuensis]MDN3601473.1 RagB/SusD family nutrient uptake outer membrane protein [Mucilaginibacter myungsuensis]